jgi:WD40 repeat protein
MNSPFKFLDSYTLADRSIFFGRDQEITELYRRVFEKKILLVYGMSGTGKSSLVNCGLASRFDESDWLPVNVRRGSSIIDSLNDAFSKQALTPLDSTLSISEKLQSIYLDHFKPVFLLFDQFEELFIFGNQQEKSDFVKVVKEISGSETRCTIIFIIREEFLAAMTEFESELSDIFTNRFRVEKMKRTNAVRAVEGPCKVFGIATEPGFSEELIDKLCPSGNEIELTYLQIYLDRIFRIAVDEKKEGAQPVFSKELLTRSGSVSDLLGQFLDEQIRGMDNPDTGMAILKSFVSVRGTKKQMTESEIHQTLQAFGTEIAEPDLIKYLNRFVDLRILRERDEAGLLELRHDALAAKIFEKFTLTEKELLEVRLFIENAYQTFIARKTSLSRDDLNYIGPFEKRLFLSPVLNRFISESKDKLQSQQRALRRLSTLVSIGFIVIVAAGIQFYLTKKGKAQIKELTTLALLQEKVNPLVSINTAFRIKPEDSTSTVIKGIILSNFYNLLQKKIADGKNSIPAEFVPRTIPVKGSILSMKTNRPGTSLYGWTDTKEIFTCGIGDSVVVSFQSGNDIVTAEMSDDARYIAVIFKDSKGCVYTGTGAKVFDFETTVNYLMNNRLVRFFPGGKFFMAAVKNNEAVIYDSTGACLFELVGHKGRVNSLDISPDGRFVATVSCDKTGLIWNFNYKTRQFSPYDTLIRYFDFKNWYDRPDSLIGPNDTIWSCEFARNGKHILTASADSMLNVWNLNGSLRSPPFIFGVNSIRGRQWYWSVWYPRLMKWRQNETLLKPYFNKVSDARFAADEKAVIALNYSYDKSVNGIDAGIYRTQVLYYDDSYVYRREQFSTNPFVLLAQSRYKIDRMDTIQILEINSDLQLKAAVPYKKNVIQIVADDGYVMLDIRGSFPVFSPDGKSLIYLYGKEIRLLPVDQNEIYDLVIEKKLFGNPETGREIWEVL